MAKRPVFVPLLEGRALVRELSIPIRWHSGFSLSQKQKNVAELHSGAASLGLAPVLEVSTRSTSKLGTHLSAFHLKVPGPTHEIPLESAFQGSKVFEGGGPFTDLYEVEAGNAKKDERLRSSGRLLGFNYRGFPFPSEPMTAFYDWLYINALLPHREWLERLRKYAAFSDIEFNPDRSINCQARSCALFVALTARELLITATRSPEAFLATLQDYSYSPRFHGGASDQMQFEPNSTGQPRTSRGT